MEKEIKQCQNCKSEFTIEPEDFEFYQKIKVPAPTFCPECRNIRRMSWRNERSLFRRTCGACKKPIISIYDPNSGYDAYCSQCFHSDSWDPLSYGKDYDFSRPFFTQFNELQKSVPRIYALVTDCINSDYVNGAYQDKDCYLIFASDHNEDSAYSHSIFYCKNIFDCLGVRHSELSSGCIDCNKISQCFNSQDCADSYNLYFCKDCANCHDCIGCVNLRNKAYCIFNEQFTKEEFHKKLDELKLGSFSGHLDSLKEAKKIHLNSPVKFYHGKNNVNSTGDYLVQTKNCIQVFDGQEMENCKYMYIVNKVKDSYDGYAVVDNVELNLEVISSNSSNAKFNFCYWSGTYGTYGDTCQNCNNIFGCVGLRNKEYCILNKQYSKEEYEKIIPQIIEHMNSMPYVDKKGRVYKYGEFFPFDLSLFAYNESVAQEFFPLTKEQAIEWGYSWKDPEQKQLTITMANDKIPDDIKDVDDSILTQVIECAGADPSASGCTQAFKIIASELEFYRKMNLPLPRFCPNCRQYQRMKQRNPLKLWKRKCMCGGKESVNSNQGTGKYQNTSQHSHGDEACPNEFETTYSPDRPEIIYCEQCYQAEVI